MFESRTLGWFNLVHVELLSWFLLASYELEERNELENFL